METVEITKPKSDSLLDQLVALYLTFKQVSLGTKVKFDFKDIGWFFPLLILPVAAYIQATDSKFTKPRKTGVESYLETISFPIGVTTISKLERLKNYIPIGILEREDKVRKERLETGFAEMIYKVLKPNVAAKNAIYLPLTELITNIFEHSEVDKGYVFAQHYPKKEFLDLCIVDRGIGLAGSYKRRKDLKLSDSQAILKALKGISVKPEQLRGYGIRVSKRVICEGLKGGFILLSGKSALYSSSGDENLYSLPGFHWQGVIIAYRIPRPNSAVDVTPFLEG